jgi:hypothetical protein
VNLDFVEVEDGEQGNQHREYDEPARAGSLALAPLGLRRRGVV